MRFHRLAFARLTTRAERAARAAELADELGRRMMSATDFFAEIAKIIPMLREQGHDLWSWDESDDFAIWGPDYHNRPELTGLLIRFQMPGDVDVEWLEGADPTDARRVFGEGFH